MKAPQFVCVLWHDAWSSDDFKTPSELEAAHVPYLRRCVGHLVRRDKTGIMIARDYDEDARGESHYDGTMFIPAGMLVSVRKVR